MRTRPDRADCCARTPTRVGRGVGRLSLRCVRGLAHGQPASRAARSSHRRVGVIGPSAAADVGRRAASEAPWRSRTPRPAPFVPIDVVRAQRGRGVASPVGCPQRQEGATRINTRDPKLIGTIMAEATPDGSPASATKNWVNPGRNKPESKTYLSQFPEFRGRDLGTNDRRMMTAHQKPGVLFPCLRPGE